MRKFFVAALFVLALLTSPLGLYAADGDQWPPKRFEIILPHDVGSTQDSTTRIIGKYWSKYWPDTQITYVSKGQSGGRLAFDQFAESPHDGSTILSSNFQTTAVFYAQQKPDWKWEEVIYPIDTYDVDMTIVQVREDSPIKSFKDLIELAKTKTLTAGVARWGTTDTLLLYQIMDLTGAQFEVIPLGTGGAARAALLGGHVDFCMRRTSDLKLDGGQIKVLAINAESNPLEYLTGKVPTVSEVVGAQVLEAGGYRTISVHPDLKTKYPDRYKDIVDILAKIKADPEFLEEAKKAGCELIESTTPEQLNGMTQVIFQAFAKYEDAYRSRQ
ncbi:MAG: hypothetical protein LBJ61_10250 [Deltaproteobacteria bacterium]|jgi:tripartite-type tricarboxylate transporter receptor subunit TctC|nr:hypothetical protein [Deltaproteobacteria bacterium]